MREWCGGAERCETTTALLPQPLYSLEKNNLSILQGTLVPGSCKKHICKASLALKRCDPTLQLSFDVVAYHITRHREYCY